VDVAHVIDRAITKLHTYTGLRADRVNGPYRTRAIGSDRHDRPAVPADFGAG
jgi:hypothetical protein